MRSPVTRNPRANTHPPVITHPRGQYAPRGRHAPRGSAVAHGPPPSREPRLQRIRVRRRSWRASANSTEGANGVVTGTHPGPPRWPPPRAPTGPSPAITLSPSSPSTAAVTSARLDQVPAGRVEAKKIPVREGGFANGDAWVGEPGWSGRGLFPRRSLGGGVCGAGQLRATGDDGNGRARCR
jgi:hypothetical protein